MVIEMQKDGYSQGLHLDGHSRGSLTIGNAMESIKNTENAVGSLSGTTISFLGPAYNAAAADDLLAYLQDRKSWANPNDGALTLQNQSNDIVGRLIGGNPATGGVTPKGSFWLWEALRVLGGTDTPHNCYSNGSEACQNLWKGSIGNESVPVPIYQIDMSTPETLLYKLERLRGK